MALPHHEPCILGLLLNKISGFMLLCLRIICKQHTHVPDIEPVGTFDPPTHYYKGQKLIKT